MTLATCPDPSCGRKLRVGLAQGDDAKEVRAALRLLADTCARCRIYGASPCASKRAIQAMEDDALEDYAVASMMIGGAFGP